MTIELRNIQIDYHRNGVGGNGFHVCTFDTTEDGETQPMVAVVFDERGSCAVFNRDLLGKGEIRFFHNSWRSDRFESKLRVAIKAHYENQTTEDSQ